MKINDRGESKLGCAVLIILFVFGIWVGLKWGYAQWDYESMRQEVSETAQYWYDKNAKTSKPIIDEIFRRADKIGLELFEDDVEVVLKENGLIIDVWWSTPIELPGYTHIIDYHVHKARFH